LPAEYHGDPANPGSGILSYRDFGWRILDEMRGCGFSRAEAIHTIGPLHGHMTFTPVIVGMR
jgi:hypothetical protein